MVKLLGELVLGLQVRSSARGIRRACMKLRGRHLPESFHARQALRLFKRAAKFVLDECSARSLMLSDFISLPDSARLA